MKRQPMPPRKVALAAGPVRLSRRSPLARRASARTARQVPAPDGRQPAQPGEDSQTAPGWPQDTREAVQRRSGGRCEVCGVQPATDLHHRKRRREGDHRVVNALHCCRTCHTGAHRHPAEAREFGWIVSAWSNPATTPLLVNGNRWVLLEPGGRYRTDQRGWPT